MTAKPRRVRKLHQDYVDHKPVTVTVKVHDFLRLTFNCMVHPTDGYRFVYVQKNPQYSGSPVTVQSLRRLVKAATKAADYLDQRGRK